MPFNKQTIRGNDFQTWLENNNDWIEENIPTYVLDSVAPPTSGTVEGRTVVNFLPSVDNIIYFDFPYINLPANETYTVSGDDYSSNDRNIRISYCMDTAAAGNVKLDIEYLVFKDDVVLDATTPTGTDTQTFTVSPTAKDYEYNESLTIDGTDLDGAVYKQTIRVKLTRSGTNVLDTHTGNLQLFDISIV